MFGALAARFGPVELDPSFAAARPKFARAALIPSRVFTDGSVWTQKRDGRRTAEFAGFRSGGRYRMASRPAAPIPREAGAYRGRLELAQRDEGDYVWTMYEELAVGAVAGDDLGRAASAALRSVETLSAAEARRRLLLELPRAAAAFGRLFSLDELRLSPSFAAGTEVRLGLTLHPERIQDVAPNYARFLRRYVTPTRLRVEASDEHRRPWGRMLLADNRMELQLRLKGGRLAPIAGAPGPIPDDLRVRLAYSARLGIFRVGLSGLDADVELTRTPREKAFAARFRRSPEWELPLLVEPLLGTALQRPFEAEGALLGYAIRDTPGYPTLITREFRLAVKESWTVRWLGRLVGGAMAEFRERAESEADRFAGECLLALRDDLVDLMSDVGTNPRASSKP